MQSRVPLGPGKFHVVVLVDHYFASCLKPLSQDEAECEASDTKIFFSVVMLIKLIMLKVLNLVLELSNGTLQ